PRLRTSRAPCAPVRSPVPYLPPPRRRSPTTDPLSSLPASCHRRSAPTPHQPGLLPLPAAPPRSRPAEKHHFLNRFALPHRRAFGADDADHLFNLQSLFKIAFF